MPCVDVCASICRFIPVLVLTLLGCVLKPATTHAELPPSAYSSFQANAPEALELMISSVQQSSSETADFHTISVVLEAKVLKVVRTTTSVKVGANLTIKYDQQQSKVPGRVGPSKVPIPNKGDRCPAYLKQTPDKPGVYEPVAGGYTFKTVKG